MSQLLTEFKDKYNVAIKASALHGLGEPSTLQKLYSAVLNANLSDIAEPGGIPPLLPAQSAAIVKAPMFLQVSASRDATQPLRPCADMSEEEAFMLGSPGQGATNKHRLLKLILTDGNLELVAVEMKTYQNVFRSIPTPGEKVMVNEGAEIKNGMLLITPESIKPLGGSVESLKKEFEFRKMRNALGVKSGGGDAAPKFQPFIVGGREEAINNMRHRPTESKPIMITDAARHTESRGRDQKSTSHGASQGRGRGREGRPDRAPHVDDSRGRGRGRASEGHRGRGSERQPRGGRASGGARYADPQQVPHVSQASNFPSAYVPAWNDAEDFPVLGDY